MLKVGLTGSIAVGKSHVLEILRELGCHTFDADKIAREVVAPGRPAYQQIVAEFGLEILQPDGQLDRAKLGALVFADAERRQRLNAIVHPFVFLEQDRLLREVAASDPAGIAVIDAALMIESGGYQRFDKLIVVFCDEETQVERLMKRNQLSRADALSRIQAQLPSSEKRRYADFEIDTSGDFAATRRQVEQIYAELRRRADERPTE